MKLTAVLLSILVAKSLSIPFFDDHEHENTVKGVGQLGATDNMTNCYESNNKIANFNNISEINHILANTENRKRIYINDTANTACGISIVNDVLQYKTDIHYGSISIVSCNSSKVICDRASSCNIAVDCCENLDNSCNNKYQLIPININSTEYNQTKKLCEVRYPQYTKCFKLNKLFKPTDSPTNSAKNILSFVYAVYILPIIVTIKVSE